MSCSNLCPCQFNWPIDTQGSKRDPISSEKAWLDFAVRSLSREAVGKGRGQETVWGAVCKPSWWDSEVGHSWKNPTANPKDTKEVLLQKYEALERHLRADGRFPQELEEEARLWGAGKYRELFLLTTLTSLLGKVTGVHTAVLDAATKTDELKAEINQSLLQDIKTCLGSSLSAIENFSCTNNSRKSLKRSSENTGTGKENEGSPTKHPRLSGSSRHQTKPKPSICDSELKQPSKTSTSQASVADISAYCRKLIAKQKAIGKVSAPNQDTRVRKEIPGRKTIPCSQPSSVVNASSSSSLLCSSSLNQTAPIATETLAQSPLAAQSPPMYINISQEELSLLLQGQPVPLLKAGNEMNSTPPLLPAATDSKAETSLTCVGSGNTERQLPAVSHSSTEPLSSVHVAPATGLSNSCQGMGEQIDSGSTFDPSLDFLESQSTDSPCGTLLPSKENIAVTNEFSSLVSENLLPNSSPSFEDILSEQEDLLSKALTGLTDLSDNATALPVADIFPDFSSSIITANVNDSSAAMTGSGSCTRSSSGRTTSSDSEHSHKISDHGYGSDEGAIDLDSLFNSEEQSKLWGEDDSYLLDRFLTDLDMS